MIRIDLYYWSTEEFRAQKQNLRYENNVREYTREKGIKVSPKSFEHAQNSIQFRSLLIFEEISSNCV